VSFRVNHPLGEHVTIWSDCWNCSCGTSFNNYQSSKLRWGILSYQSQFQGLRKHGEAHKSEWHEYWSGSLATRSLRKYDAIFIALMIQQTNLAGRHIRLNPLQIMGCSKDIQIYYRCNGKIIVLSTSPICAIVEEIGCLNILTNSHKSPYQK